MIKRIGQFVVEMCKTWGALLTGGFVIAILASWQITGHDIPTKLGWTLIVGGVIVAAFQVWNRQVNLTELASQDLKEEKRKSENVPIVLLYAGWIKKVGEPQLELTLYNRGFRDCYNVKIHPIKFPQGTATFPEISKLLISEFSIALPNINPAKDFNHRHDFVQLIHDQPEDFLLSLRIPDCEGKIDPIIAIPVDITYTNNTGIDWFITKMNIIYDFNELGYFIDTKLVETKSIPKPN